jgi:hypothetical protein
MAYLPDNKGIKRMLLSFPICLREGVGGRVKDKPTLTLRIFQYFCSPITTLNLH